MQPWTAFTFAAAAALALAGLIGWIADSRTARTACTPEEPPDQPEQDARRPVPGTRHAPRSRAAVLADPAAPKERQRARKPASETPLASTTASAADPDHVPSPWVPRGPDGRPTRLPSPGSSIPRCDARHVDGSRCYGAPAPYLEGYTGPRYCEYHRRIADADARKLKAEADAAWYRRSFQL